jgi:hypothetical protein
MAELLEQTGRIDAVHASEAFVQVLLTSCSEEPAKPVHQETAQRKSACGTALRLENTGMTLGPVGAGPSWLWDSEWPAAAPLARSSASVGAAGVTEVSAQLWALSTAQTIPVQLSQRAECSEKGVPSAVVGGASQGLPPVFDASPPAAQRDATYGSVCFVLHQDVGHPLSPAKAADTGAAGRDS